MVESDDVVGYWLSVCGHDKMTARNTWRGVNRYLYSVPVAEKARSVSSGYRPLSSLMVVWVRDEGTSNKSRTEMWQKPTEHAAGSVCCRNSLVVTKSDIKEYSMWRKKTQTRNLGLSAA